MYYYGGYQGYGGYPYGGCGCNNNYGYGNGGAILLVLFILLVIVVGSRIFDNNYNR